MAYIPPVPVIINFTGSYVPPASNDIAIDLAQSGDTDQSQVGIQAAGMLFLAV